MQTIALSMFSPSAGNAEPRKKPSSVMLTTHSAAPTALHTKNLTRAIRVTPATTVM